MKHPFDGRRVHIAIVVEIAVIVSHDRASLKRLIIEKVILWIGVELARFAMLAQYSFLRPGTRSPSRQERCARHLQTHFDSYTLSAPKLDFLRPIYRPDWLACIPRSSVFSYRSPEKLPHALATPGRASASRPM